MTQSEVLGEVTPTKNGTERIASIDVLRGVAVLGILVINVASFAFSHDAQSNPLLLPHVTAADVSLWQLTQVFFLGKML